MTSVLSNGKQQSPLRLLIANRGEIALRIIRSAELFPRHNAPYEFRCFVLYTKAEAGAAHVLAVPPAQRILLPGQGPKAYLDAQTVVRLAKENDVWGIAPGYGFLSESAAFCAMVERAGIAWIGPTHDQLQKLSDKVTAKRLARESDVPTLLATNGQSASVEEVKHFARQLRGEAKLIIKAVSGGGGRGMRVVSNDEREIEDAYASCTREAKSSFGDERVYAERYLELARHVEVQIVGDGTGDVAHLWERECSIQRRHQKLVEIAPSPTLHTRPALRRRIIDAAVRMAQQTHFRSLGTFEFLVLPVSDEFFFMEVNPRIQVEHTITEQITSFDVVALQLQIALGARLSAHGLGQSASPLPLPHQTSIQVRINAERFVSDGSVMPTSGTLKAFNVPFGPGIRVDTCAHAPLQNGIAYTQTALFDSLMAKVIFTAPTYALAVQLASTGLASLGITGVETNLAFIRALIDCDAVRANEGVHTRFVEQNFDLLYDASKAFNRTESADKEETNVDEKSVSADVPQGADVLASPLSGLVTQISVQEGDTVRAGQEVALLESMKMEHVVRATQSGAVVRINAQIGAPIAEGDAILSIKTPDGDNSVDEGVDVNEEVENVDDIRDDLALLLERRRLYADEQRTTAVQRRREAGFLTARENVALLVDANTFIEWGDLQFAAQRTRVDEDELRARTSNDGVITGWATVNGTLFNDASTARCALCIYDYMVLAGTQGHFHHLKLDRLFRSVLANPAPIVVYAEGGGGRPGDVDLVNMKVAGLDTPSFALMAAIRARGYPSVGLANGYTFAGNAALLGTCDIVVATQGGANDAKRPGATSTGMGGPAMIEGGGLGKVNPQDVGPLDVHVANGDYDVVVSTEREAATTIKKLVSFFQGALPTAQWRYTSDVKRLRTLLPKQRTRAYDVRRVVETMTDDASFIELGSGWGHSIVTGLARIEGQPVGILASSVLSPLGGAIDAASAQKASRLVNMLRRTRAAHLIVLCDTPGFMVGTSAEKQGGLRTFAEFFAAMMAFQQGDDGGGGGRVFAVTLRKAYGLGAQAMLGGSTLQNFFCVAWPQGEFAGMGIEGAVRLGMRKELEAAQEGQEREELFTSLVDMMYQRGKAHNMAALAEIDTVIDPAETRQWLVNGLRLTRARVPTWKGERHSSSHL